MPEHSNHSSPPRPLVITHGSLADRDLYEKWDRVRLAVFGDELGWHLASRSPGASEPRDPCDEHAIFFAAISRGSIVGILRALNVGLAFPHRELFETHLRRSDLHRHLAMVWTLNALAVVPSTYLYPAWDAELRRTVLFVPAGGQVPENAEWLVVGPSRPTNAGRLTAGGWRLQLASSGGWRIFRQPPCASSGYC